MTWYDDESKWRGIQEFITRLKPSHDGFAEFGIYLKKYFALPSTILNALASGTKVESKYWNLRIGLFSLKTILSIWKATFINDRLLHNNLECVTEYEFRKQKTLETKYLELIRSNLQLKFLFTFLKKCCLHIENTFYVETVNIFERQVRL